ncbi:Mylk [Acrasis kona]|uniref:Mylk n=1 Tax=Acrasis kona TaxID=1008807 RepID=A0AAW2YIC2_9EUKA
MNNTDQPYYQPFVYVPQDLNNPPQLQQFGDPQQQQFYPQAPIQQIPIQHVPIYSPAQAMFQPIVHTENSVNTTEREGTPTTRYVKKLSGYKFCASISIASFVLYFLFTPGTFPWFLVIACFSCGAMGSKYIRENHSNDYPRFRKHICWFVSINMMFILFNLWSGGFPWSVIPTAVWGAAVGLHAIHTLNNEPLKTRLFKHLVIFSSVALIALVMLSHDPCPPKYNSSMYRKFNNSTGVLPKSIKQRPYGTNRPVGSRRPQQRPSRRPVPAGSRHPQQPEQPAGPIRPQESRQPQQKPAPQPGQPEQPTGPTRPEDRDPNAKKNFKKRVYCEDGFYYTYVYDPITKIVVVAVLAAWFAILVVYGLKVKRTIRSRNQQLAQVPLEQVNVQVSN